MTKITRRTFVAGAVAASAVTAHAADPELQRKINALPASTPQEKRKKAMLLWAVEDIAAAQSAGMADDAAALAVDVQAALEQPLGNSAPVHMGLFPKIATRQNNPWLDAVVRKVRGILAAEQKFPRGANPDTKSLGIKAGYPYIQLGEEGATLARAFGSPETDLYGDPALIAPMLRRFAASYEILTPGSKHLADFGVTPHISQMYCLLKASFPDLILPSRQKAWEQALVLNCEATLKAPGQVFSEPGMPTEPLEQMLDHPGPGDCYPNAQSHLILGLLCCGIALRNDRYLKAADEGVTLMATAFYPDGATAYIDFQNECFTYHGIMIEDLARIAQITGSRKALDLVRSARWYYPLSITPQGIAEYSSAPCWKHYWNGIKGTATADIIASLMDCGYNAAVAENADPESNWLAATVYRPVAAQPWWDNAIFYDRNIEGPRGRFGQYSFCATARNTREAKRGKITYVGNLWVDRLDHNPRGKNGWPLNAGLDGAWAEVRLNDKPETVNRWDTHACLSRNETLASMANERFGAVTARYQLAQYGQPAIAFEGTQQWLITQQRLVGLISLESLSDQQFLAMGVALKTVSGRGNSGRRKQWDPAGPHLFAYGALTIRLWPAGESASDLVASGAVQTGYTDTVSGNTGMCGLLTLIDPAAARAQQQEKTQYPKGARWSAAVEIYPTSFGGASAVKRVPTPAGLVGIELQEGDQTLTLLHNPTESAIDFSPTAAGATLHRSGERHRVAFLPGVESIAPIAAPGTIAVRAGEHIVLRTT